MTGLNLAPDPAHPGYFLPTPRVLPYPGVEGYYFYQDPDLPVLVPSGVDALTANPRVQRYSFERLTRAMTPIDALEGVTGGTVALVASASVHSGGSLEVNDLGQGIAWESERIRITAHVKGYGEWGLGVFIPSVPSERWKGPHRSWSVELLGLEVALQRVALESSFVAAAGANVIDLVRSLIEQAGERAGALTDVGRTVATDRVWPAGTRILSVINTLLDSAYYFSLWADGMGQFRAEPRTLPAERPVRWEFTDGPRGIYDDTFTHERDLYNVPNKALGTTPGDDENPGLISVAENDDPSDPLSTVHRGIVYTDDSVFEVDATDQEALDGLTASRLASLTAPASTVKIAALPVPLAHNDACRFARTPANIDGRYVVGRAEYDLTETGLMTVELRGVAS